MTKRGTSDWRAWLDAADRAHVAQLDECIEQFQLELTYKRAERQIWQRRAIARRATAWRNGIEAPVSD